MQVDLNVTKKKKKLPIDIFYLPGIKCFAVKEMYKSSPSLNFTGAVCEYSSGAQ